jgi:cytochrome c-type biogenesis protein CcsB
MALWAATSLYAIGMVAYAIRLARVAEARGAAVPVAAAQDRGHADSSSAGPVAPPPADKAYGIARATTVVGAVLHMVGVVARGIESGHVPWSTMYEYTISGSLVAVVVFLIVQTRRDVTYLGAGVVGLATVSVGLALTVLYAASTGLPPALQSFWLVIHVAIAVIATGVLAVAFLASLLQLTRDFRSADPDAEGPVVRFLARGLKSRRLRALEATPAPSVLEGLAFRLNAVGFVLWTFTVMAGAVWAEHAWGRYWGWDPKEVWSFVIWVIYAAYLHARTTQGWAGRPSAYVAIGGFIAVIMNFTVVNLVFQGLHSYAGV